MNAATTATDQLAAFAAAFAEHPAAVALESLVAIEVRGDDVEAFLQGQFSNDVAAAQIGACQLNAYCNPKGRVIALIRLVRSKDGFWLIVPAALSESLLARLRMYVLRAKVELTLRSEIELHGLIGETEVTSDGVEIASVDGIVARAIMIAENTDALRDIEARAHPPIPADAPADAAWRLLDILAGVPQVHAQTSEQFIPQTINLDLIDAISFTKGCYPGQEIIARLRHRGKIKQRLLAAVAELPSAPAPFDPLYASFDPPQKAGAIVDAVCIGAQSYAFSATAAVDENERETLSAIPSESTQAIRIALPYSIPD